MGKLSFIAGLAAGYVLGAKAGRQRYEQIARTSGKVWNSDPVQKQVERGKEVARTKAAPVVADMVADAARATGEKLRQIVRQEMHSALLAPRAPYNLKAANGVSCTTASLIAAALGIKDISRLSAEQRQQIKKLHLLLAAFNALQPGVFALSGWDLVGALPLPKASVAKLLADGDTRWINRGAYDLLGQNPQAQASAAGLPRAEALYGSLPEQLKDPQSFASQLKHILAVRARYGINQAEQLAIPTVQAKALLLMVHRLPDG